MGGAPPPATQVYRVSIRATPEAIWEALTSPDWTQQYGYGGRADYDPDLRAGATYRAFADAELRAGGIPEVAIQGEVIEADPPHRLVQTWQAQWEPVEGVTRLTYEITPGEDGVTTLTVTHELAGAPGVAAVVGGELADTGAGGGWQQVLSELKALLETGPARSG